MSETGKREEVRGNKSAKKKAFRMTVAERMRKYGVPEGGTTVVVEHGIASLSSVSALVTVPGRSVDALRAHVNRLHAERGEAVLEAKKSREEQGFKSAAFQLDWQHVEDLTRAIVYYEGALEKELEADASLPHPERVAVPLLRDPEVEMPDDGFHVVAVTDDETESVVLAYHDAGSWIEVDGDSVMDGSVVGWCWQDEAATVLRKAVRQ